MLTLPKFFSSTNPLIPQKPDIYGSSNRNLKKIWKGKMGFLILLTGLCVIFELNSADSKLIVRSEAATFSSTGPRIYQALKDKDSRTIVMS